MNLRKGFTLIELLVVIAIIGLLSSVVLASLNGARQRGADTTIKGQLSALRAVAELHYDNNGSSYATFCNITTGSVDAALDAIKTAAGPASTGANTINSIGATGIITCNSTAGGWAVQSPLRSTAGTTAFWCVDSSGLSQLNGGSALTTATDIDC